MASYRQNTKNIPNVAPLQHGTLILNFVKMSTFGIFHMELSNIHNSQGFPPKVSNNLSMVHISMLFNMACQNLTFIILTCTFQSQSSEQSSGPQATR